MLVYCLFASPYFNYDAFMNLALHVLDAPGKGNNGLRKNREEESKEGKKAGKR